MNLEDFIQIANPHEGEGFIMTKPTLKVTFEGSPSQVARLVRLAEAIGAKQVASPPPPSEDDRL